MLATNLTNLVENAIKYTSGVGTQVTINGGVTADMESNANQNSSAEKWVWLTIADDGPGIAPEHLPYLFGRFYQVAKARTRTQTELKGSGLGLSIVQWVAQVHGGSVTVESKVGAGTTFEVRLPFYEN